MALGTCRHCATRGIPTDAPICRSCAGWRPNPGFFTRLGVVTNRLVGLLLLLAGIGMIALPFTRGNATEGGMLIYMGVFPTLWGSTMLFRSLVRPYGQAPSDA